MHPTTLAVVENIGVACVKQGKFGKAEQSLLRALAGYEETLGPKYASTLNTVKSLGTLFYNQGKLSKAKPLLMRARKGLQK